MKFLCTPKHRGLHTLKVRDKCLQVTIVVVMLRRREGGSSTMMWVRSFPVNSAWASFSMHASPLTGTL